jgi:hypothetical protein
VSDFQSEGVQQITENLAIMKIEKANMEKIMIQVMMI